MCTVSKGLHCVIHNSPKCHPLMSIKRLSVKTEPPRPCYAPSQPNSSFSISFINIFYVHGCLVCVYVCLKRREEGIGSPKPGVTDGWRLLYGYWEPRLGTLQEFSMCSDLLSYF